MGRRRIDRLWSKVHDRERRARDRHSGWGKPLEECQREWREWMEQKVAEGYADTVEEAARLTWEGIYADIGEREGRSVEEVKEEFEEERRRWREGRYYEPRPRS